LTPASDFRSDTVTRPSAAMRRAMAEAEVGDDVLEGDPTVARLERFAAEWLGKDGALYVPSGTMANQVALGCWTRPGEDIVAERGAHVLRYEGGAAGALHGVQSTTLVGDRGALDPEELRGVIRPGSVHEPRTALVCVEQTHMGSGGRVVPFERLRAVREVAAEHGLPVHMDGARLANAVVASGRPAREWAGLADSVSVCLSKGLGAPVGSVIAGDAAFIERARFVRKRLGGAMRQSGVLAAAGLMALEENVERLAGDHALARQLAAACDAAPGLACPPDDVETNLVLVDVDPARWTAAELAAALGEHGVLVLPLGPRTLRFVTHLDVGPEDVERLRSALDAIGS
jgi:threonine aldolase